MTRIKLLGFCLKDTQIENRTVVIIEFHHPLKALLLSFHVYACFVLLFSSSCDHTQAHLMMSMATLLKFKLSI